MPSLSLTTAELIWKSDQPYSTAYHDCYFSSAGALEEATHVFIQGNQLRERWASLSTDQFVIGEIGFGAGRNFLLTLAYWMECAPHTAQLYYVAFESQPLLQSDLERILALWPQLVYARELIRHYPAPIPGMHMIRFEHLRVTLFLCFEDASTGLANFTLCGEGVLENTIRQRGVDAWFLDGFSPAKNPSAWSGALFKAMAVLSHPGSTCASYSVAQPVRSGLNESGFMVQKTPGYGTKHEMLQAVFPTRGRLGIGPTKDGKLNQPLGTSTPWYVGLDDIPNHKNKTCIVIGAGLAGCYIAYELAQTGWTVTLLDEHAALACGASGHDQALLFPGLFHSSNTLAAFMQTGYFYSAHQLLHWQAQGVAQQTGLFYVEKKQRAHPFAKRIEASLASELVGIPLSTGGYYFSEAGWVDLPQLCEWLVMRDSISLYAGEQVHHIHREGGMWQVGAHQASTLVLANGMGASAFPQTRHVAFNAVQGQMSWVPATTASRALNMPLCGHGQVLPVKNGLHAVGATYEPISSSTTQDGEIKNLARLRDLSPVIEWPSTVSQNWIGVRTATEDYFPCVGKIAIPEQFKQHYASLRLDAKRWIPSVAKSELGLYLFAGFGSKGLTTIPFLAHALAAEINGGRMLLPRQWIKALSPNRFLYRECVTHG